MIHILECLCESCGGLDEKKLAVMHLRLRIIANGINELKPIWRCYVLSKNVVCVV